MPNRRGRRNRPSNSQGKRQQQVQTDSPEFGRTSDSYQGKKRCFGWFRCAECSRRWKSGNSWANIGQQCKSCNILVYPYKQRPFNWRGNLGANDHRIHHPEELCQKCKGLGYYCGTSVYDRDYYDLDGIVYEF